jgi:enoyl-CoA hydratase
VTRGYDDFAPELIVERRGPLRLLTLNRPDALNATNLALHDAITEVWDALATDADARAVVLTGAGRAFSAGGDLGHIQAMQEDAELRRHDMEQAAALVRAMTSCALPIVAAVNGPAIGLGATLAVLCDIVLIHEDAYLCDPHVSVGLTAGDGGAALWPLLMGMHRAKEFLLTGDRIPAASAVELGLANRIVAGDTDVVAEAVALAERLAAQPRQAVASTKRTLNLHLEAAIGSILDAALAEEFKTFDDDEHRAAVRQLLDQARRDHDDKSER